MDDKTLARAIFFQIEGELILRINNSESGPKEVKIASVIGVYANNGTFSHVLTEDGKIAPLPAMKPNGG